MVEEGSWMCTFLWVRDEVKDEDRRSATISPDGKRRDATIQPTIEHACP